MTLALLVAALAPGCRGADSRPVELRRIVAKPMRTVTPTHSPGQPQARPAAALPTRPMRSDAPSRPTGDIRTVDSTAYCETGGMANGQRAYWGAVAMNTAPMGSRWRILTGSWAGHVVTVADHIGWGSEFDIAMPDPACGPNGTPATNAYGRQEIRIERTP